MTKIHIQISPEIKRILNGYRQFNNLNMADGARVGTKSNGMGQPDKEYIRFSRIGVQIVFSTGGGEKWMMNSNGDFRPITDNAIKLGVSSYGIKEIHIATDYALLNLGGDLALRNSALTGYKNFQCADLHLRTGTISGVGTNVSITLTPIGTGVVKISGANNGFDVNTIADLTLTGTYATDYTDIENKINAIINELRNTKVIAT